MSNFKENFEPIEKNVLNGKIYLNEIKTIKLEIKGWKVLVSITMMTQNVFGWMANWLKEAVWVKPTEILELWKQRCLH